MLWLVSEDNEPFLGCYGEPLAQTPTLDRLASEGVRYTGLPAPAPTRSSLITGRYAPALGTRPMRCVVPMPESLHCDPALLRDAGYFCTNNAETDCNAEVPPGTWDESGTTAHWGHRAAVQPFFAVVADVAEARADRPDLPAGQPIAYLWRMASMVQWHARHLAGDLDPG